MVMRAVNALLIDRDGTLVEDVPYNGDPHRVRPRPTVRRGLARARRHGLALAIVSNQSGVARGLLTLEQVSAVNRRVEQLLGPFDAIVTCPHRDEDLCACRKPRPGMLHIAAAKLRVDVRTCVVIGDIGSDMAAAAAAGASGVLVPTAATRGEEISAAAHVATDFDAAVGLAFELGA